MNLAHVEIKGKEPGPHVLITGGVHGDEYEPMAAVRKLISILKAEKLRGRVTLVPVVNESAYRLGQRTGDDGRDLGRTCPGRADGSSTERAAHDLSALIRSADYFMDLHTGGARLSVHPLTGYTLHRDPGVLAKQRRMARAFGLPVIWGTDPSFEGRSLSVARDANVPAIYAEYHGGGVWDPAGVESYVCGCLNVLGDVGVVDRSPVCPQKEPLVVEDPRPGSGHMQVNHPSPMEGFFEPAVELGQWVKTGDVLGIVTDLVGERVETIRSRYSGMMLVIHSRCFIAREESVGVVLEEPN